MGAGSVPKRQAARSQPWALRAQDDTVPFGYWPAGEPDPWRDTADFLPAPFGYKELYEVSTPTTTPDSTSTSATQTFQGSG